MRALAAASACTLALLAAALAGCASDEGDGELHVHVTDAPGAIGDFASLDITVSNIVLKHAKAGGGETWSNHTPASPSFDLVRLVDGNLTTIFGDEVENGTYKRIELEVASATGVLKSGGAPVTVKAPKGSIFVNTGFTVGSGEEVHFLFDIHVVKKGNGEYSLQPNAGGSKVIGEPKAGKVPK